MTPSPEGARWLGPTLLEPGLDYANHPREFDRLWRAFMTARATLGLVLVLLQSVLFFLSGTQSSLHLLICGAYFAATLSVRLMMQPQKLGQTFDAQWLRTVGVDLITFAALQSLQGSSINYAPLFALPVLMASVLGSLIMAMGTAAGVTLLLFTYATWQSAQTPWDSATYFLQAALTGAGCFAISFLASQLSMRLSSVELRAQRSQLAATVQRQVNALVIESLSDGILVVDERYRVRSANPAACVLLGLTPQTADTTWPLTGQSGWRTLLDVVILSYTTECPQQADLTIRHEGQGPRHLRVRTQLTTPLEADAQPLCVVFMQDQREMQARLRTEKLASMGRLSAAVAHEIRNPLAAIVQANALLTEDLQEASQLRLTQMVRQNAQRLEKIVYDILHLAQAPHQRDPESGRMLDLNESIERVCRDWQRQAALTDTLSVSPAAGSPRVWFDAEHLRRILVNLLDNARRFASGQKDAIQVSVTTQNPDLPAETTTLSVWSDGGPLEPSVEQHLFEPFFSSDSRSSGLGLYICRELCESHGASMTYDRSTRLMNQHQQSGNEFSVTFRTTAPHHQATTGQEAPAP